MDLKIAAIVAIVMLALGGVAGLVIAPDSAATILSVIGPTLAVLAVFLKANEIGEDTKATKAVAVGTALAVDGRLDQMLKLVQESAKAQGKLEGETGVYQELPPTALPAKGETVKVVLPNPELPTKMTAAPEAAQAPAPAPDQPPPPPASTTKKDAP